MCLMKSAGYKYSDLLIKNPYITKSLTAAGIFSASDIIT